jgi:hypothetical protein
MGCLRLRPQISDGDGDGAIRTAASNYRSLGRCTHLLETRCFTDLYIKLKLSEMRFIDTDVTALYHPVKIRCPRRWFSAI